MGPESCYNSYLYLGTFNRLFSLGRFFVPLQTTWYSLENCSFIHLKIIYSYTRNYLKIWKEAFSRVSLHGLEWDNKPPSRKRSIRLFIEVKLKSNRIQSSREVSFNLKHKLASKRPLGNVKQEKSKLFTLEIRPSDSTQKLYKQVTGTKEPTVYFSLRS